MSAGGDLLISRRGRAVQVVLNSEATLNALSLDMAAALLNLLEQWAEDPEVACVVFQGAGDRAFCAGGDIQSLYANMQRGDHAACDAFFATEYRMDLALHRFPKPTIAWTDGIVMGGGMGVMQGCSHRIVTPRTRMAMPETHIGFLPDVGAGFFLNRRGDRLEWLLALTGGQIGADDAVFLGLADCTLAGEAHSDLLEFAASGPDAASLSDWLRRRHAPIGGGWMEGVRDELAAAAGLGSCTQVLDRLAEQAGCNPDIERFCGRVGYASPLAQRLTWGHLERSRGLDIGQALGLEYDLVCRLSRHGEFAEGVRALIIDKDQSPAWSQLPDSLGEWFEPVTGFDPANKGAAA